MISLFRGKNDTLLKRKCFKQDCCYEQSVKAENEN